MKKSMNIYKRIVSETDTGFLVVYYLDKEDESYEEIMRIDEDFLKLEGDPACELFTAIEIFDKIIGNLKEGLYFCVLRGNVGSDWFTRDTSNSSIKNPVLADSR